VRIEFAMHGEPTFNEQMFLIVKEFAKLHMCSLMMTTNGAGLAKHKDRVFRLFEAGLHTLAIDEYEGITYGNQIRDFFWAKQKEFYHAGVKKFEYPVEPEGNPHTRKMTKRLVFIADINKVKDGYGTHSKLNNHCGAGAPKNDTKKDQRCAKPFRELSIRYNGAVAVCCNDWRGEYIIGNIKDFKSIEDLWQSEPFVLARKKLYNKERDFGPCDGCDAVSTRVGLLPDRMGKQSLPPLTAHEKRKLNTIVAAGVAKPLAKPFLRTWEKKAGKK